MTSLPYSKEYWDDYYSGTYEDTYQFGFNPTLLLKLYGDPPPQSFADIGCGLGHTLLAMEDALGKNAKIYGVECQDIPKERRVSDKIIFGDFTDLHQKLEPVDFLYATCSMYISWKKQGEFLDAVLRLAKRAIYFANVYVGDKRAIPEDILRKTVYKDRASFSSLIKSQGFLQSNPRFDFYQRTEL